MKKKKKKESICVYFQAAAVTGRSGRHEDDVDL